MAVPLGVSQRHDRDQIAQMQAVGSGIEADVNGAPRLSQKVI